MESYPESLIALLYRAPDNLQMRVSYELCTIISVVIQAKRQNKIMTVSHYFIVIYSGRNKAGFTQPITNCAQSDCMTIKVTIVLTMRMILLYGSMIFFYRLFGVMMTERK
jgi:hypothetical protein